MAATIAKEKNGQIQITLTLPADEVKKAQAKVSTLLAKNITVPGFRKGKAPLKKALEKIDPEELTRQTLNELLPKHFAAAVKKHKIKPAIYPRFEIVATPKNKAWQVRAITCEIPEVELGDYKKKLKEAKSTDIWTPDKGKAEEKTREPSREEKEQKAISLLLGSVKVDLPEFLIEEEVNHRLVHLVERLEKLGVSLDKYLESVGKTGESLRQEYKKQAEEAIKMELILNKVAESEKIKIEDEQIEEMLKTASLPDNQEQRNAVAAVLRKRGALDSLVALM